VSIAAAFAAIGWNETVEQFRRSFSEQESGVRSVFVATLNQGFAGYVTLNWQPTYPTFKAIRGSRKSRTSMSFRGFVNAE
jgi:hypothetical protein